jgi:CDP-glucose 4,6-dehydratase
MVGSWLTKALVEQGAYVAVLIRDADPQSQLFRSGTINRVNVVNGSLEDYPTLERAINEHELDTVFHLGAQTIVGTALRSPLPTFEANIRGTYNLLEAARQMHPLVKQVVVASSDKAYGDSEELPYTEDMPLRGEHPYDVSKSCTDLLAHAYAKTYGLPVVIARCGNIYGGGDLNWSRIVPGTIRSLYRGEPPIIRSNGLFVRDYVYVKDIVTAYLLLGQELVPKALSGEAFNFSPESRVTVLEIVHAVAEATESKLVPVVLDQVKAEIKDQFLSAEKAKTVLGWQPEYSLRAGLFETVNWYRTYLAEQGSPHI